MGRRLFIAARRRRRNASSSVRLRRSMRRPLARSITLRSSSVWRRRLVSCEVGDGQVQGRRQLGGAEGLQQIGHHPGGLHAGDEVVARVAGEQHDRTPRALGDLAGDGHAVAVGQADRDDDDVGVHARHHRDGVDTARRLAAHFSASRPHRRPYRGARALMIVHDRDPPPRASFRSHIRHAATLRKRNATAATSQNQPLTPISIRGSCLRSQHPALRLLNRAASTHAAPMRRQPIYGATHNRIATSMQYGAGSSPQPPRGRHYGGTGPSPRGVDCPFATRR